MKGASKELRQQQQDFVRTNIMDYQFDNVGMTDKHAILLLRHRYGEAIGVDILTQAIKLFEVVKVKPNKDNDGLLLLANYGFTY